MRKLKVLYLGVFQQHCSDKYRVRGFGQANIISASIDYRSQFKEGGKKGLWRKVEGYLKDFKPDIVFVNKGEKFKAINIKLLKQRYPDPKWLLFYGDHLITIPDFLKENVKMYDAVLVETDDDEYCGKLYDAGAKDVFYHHSATDLSTFQKHSDIPEVSDVAFFGNNYSTFELSQMREDMIKAIMKSDFKLELYGASTWWGQCKGLRWGEDYSKAASRSKIILGISTTAKMNKFASNRVWNSMAAGFHLLHYFKGIEEIFVNHQHLVWFHDIVEMLDLIDYYTKHESERQRIYSRGLALIKTTHTY